MVSLTISTRDQFELVASSNQTEGWQLFYSVKLLGQPQFTINSASNVVELKAGKKQTLHFRYNRHPALWLRIDTGNGPGRVRLYGLTAKNKDVDEIHFTPTEIYHNFRVGRPEMTMTLGKNFVEITSTTVDPYLISQKRLLPIHNLGWRVIPLFFLSFLLYKALCTVNFDQCKSFFFVTRENHAKTSVIKVLDGLRGMGALMVIADHTWPRFAGVGASGVMIFFALSGFLLARPFVTQPGLFFKKDFLRTYAMRRLKRILPMYYFYIFLVYILSQDLGDAVLHAVFLKGAGHLWAIPQEMLFYFIFPLLTLLLAIVCRGKRLLVIPLLTAMIFLSNSLLTIDVFSLNGMNNQPLPFYLGVFLSGCCCAYIYFGFFASRQQEKEQPNNAAWFTKLLPIVILSLFILFSNGYLLGNRYIFAQQFYGLFGFAAAILILFLVLEQKSPLATLLSHPFFQMIGIISYSLYLIHPLILNIIVHANDYFFNFTLPGYLLWLLTLLLSLPAAMACYKYIELPFFIPVKK